MTGHADLLVEEWPVPINANLEQDAPFQAWGDGMPASGTRIRSTLQLFQSVTGQVHFQDHTVVNETLYQSQTNWEKGANKSSHELKRKGTHAYIIPQATLLQRRQYDPFQWRQS